MIASGVQHADLLNAVNATYGVDQALLQAILDFTGQSLFTLPDSDAVTFAQLYASKKGILSASAEMTDAETNFNAAAWWLATKAAQYGPGWTIVAMFFEVGPHGEAQARRVARVFYPPRYKAWA